MGCEGGSLPTRRDLVRKEATKKDNGSAQPDVRLARFGHCALTGEPLGQALVATKGGLLVNKEAFLMALLSGKLKVKKGDWIDVSVTTDKPSHLGDGPKIICPVSQKCFDGVVSFIVCRPCGCLQSADTLWHSGGSCHCGSLVESTIRITQSHSL